MSYQNEQKEKAYNELMEIAVSIRTTGFLDKREAATLIESFATLLYDPPQKTTIQHNYMPMEGKLPKE